MVEPFTLTHERTLPVDRDTAYRWLTDYDEADPDRTGTVIAQREVLERDDDAGRTVLAERIESLGMEREVRTIVELDPPGAWTATVHGADAGRPDLFSYRLDPVDASSCRLTATYRYHVSGWFEKAMLSLLSPLIRYEVDRMWRGFEDALRREVVGRP